MDLRAERSSELPKDPSFILTNHSSAYDFIPVNRILPVYFRAMVTKSLLDNHKARVFLPLVLDFIYRQKGMRADEAIEEAKKSIAAGDHVFMLPEGSATGSGETLEIRPRTGSMIRESGAGMVTI